MSIGEVLATARRQAGLTTTQVSQRTRIREGIVRGIEADDFSACGGDFYARGHIRAIARSVGTDPEPLVREYDSSHRLPPVRRTAAAVAEAVAEFDDSLPVFTLAGSEMSDAAAKAGLPVVTEFFADRPLRGDGSVVMFGWADVFTATPETLAARVRDLLATGQVKALDGTPVPVRASTVCVHSDTPGAELLGPAVRAVFDELPVQVQAPSAGQERT